MRIDNARHHRFAGTINDLCFLILACDPAWTDSKNTVAPDHDGTVFNRRSTGAVNNANVVEHRCRFGLLSRKRAASPHRVSDHGGDGESLHSGGVHSHPGWPLQGQA